MSHNKLEHGQPYRESSHMLSQLLPGEMAMAFMTLNAMTTHLLLQACAHLCDGRTTVRSVESQNVPAGMNNLEQYLCTFMEAASHKIRFLSVKCTP